MGDYTLDCDLRREIHEILGDFLEAYAECFALDALYDEADSDFTLDKDEFNERLRARVDRYIERCGDDGANLHFGVLTDRFIDRLIAAFEIARSTEPTTPKGTGS